MGGINKLQMANSCSLMFIVGFPSLILTFRSSPQGTFKATTVSDPKGCPGVDTGVTWKFSGYQRGKWSSNMSKTSLGLPFQNITKCAKQIWKSSWIMILIPVSGMEKRFKKTKNRWNCRLELRVGVPGILLLEAGANASQAIGRSPVFSADVRWTVRSGSNPLPKLWKAWSGWCPRVGYTV